MKKKQCIEDIILTSQTGNINVIPGDPTEVMKAIYSLHKQGLIEILIKDEQSTPMTYKITDEGKLLVLNGSYRKWKWKNWLKKVLENIKLLTVNIFFKSIGIIIVVTTYKALSQ